MIYTYVYCTSIETDLSWLASSWACSDSPSSVGEVEGEPVGKPSETATSGHFHTHLALQLHTYTCSGIGEYINFVVCVSFD